MQLVQDSIDSNGEKTLNLNLYILTLLGSIWGVFLK